MGSTSNSEFKQHISNEERQKWDKCVFDFNTHLGSRGVENHALGDGTTAGFSMDNFTHAEKEKLAGIQDGALNNPHPATHPASMITGLHSIATSGEFSELENIPPTCYVAEKGNCNTINGVRITIGGTSPSNPQNMKDIWFDTGNKLIKYYNSGWVAFCAVWA